MSGFRPLSAKPHRTTSINIRYLSERYLIVFIYYLFIQRTHKLVCHKFLNAVLLFEDVCDSSTFYNPIFTFIFPYNFLLTVSETKNDGLV